jgi:5-(carboxyamino)imidazole ribonucleotide mutase
MNGPFIHVMVGSESDAPLVKKKCTDVLEKIGVSFTFSVGSAHRDPDEVRQDVIDALKRGVEVFIAIAGLTNGLAGTVAAHAPLACVIGVPLDRVEGLNSVVDMPPGRPVFVVGVGAIGLTKAAEAACLILRPSHGSVAELYDDYIAALKEKKPPRSNIKIRDLVPKEA